MVHNAVCVIRGDPGVEGVIRFTQHECGKPTTIEGELNLKFINVKLKGHWRGIQIK